jgi:hypothetical protein
MTLPPDEQMLAAAGRTAERLRAAAASICSSGGSVMVKVVDASREADVIALFDEAAGENDLELVVYNVGNNFAAPALETQTKLFEDLWRQNALGGFLVGREAVRRFAPRDVKAKRVDMELVQRIVNGDPRIPYDDDYVLHNMLHEGEISSLQSATARVTGLLDVTVFRDDELHASLFSGMRIDADSVETRALPGSTNMYLIRGAYFDAAWRREGGAADTLWTSQLPPRAVSGTRVLEFVRRLGATAGLSAVHLISHQIQVQDPQQATEPFTLSCPPFWIGSLLAHRDRNTFV